MLSHIREGHGLGKNVYLLIDDRKHELRYYAFTTWARMCKKAAELILDEKDILPEKLRLEVEELFRQDKYEEALYAWREGYGWAAGVVLRCEILQVNKES
jgi:hypothetical protein